MYRLLLPFLQIALVLACPMFGGRCCSGTETFGGADVVASSDSCICDCHESQPVAPEDPHEHDCPDECQSCICQGAVVADGSVSDAEKLTEVVWYDPHLRSASVDLGVLRSRFDSNQQVCLPDQGRRLATLCLLLI